MRLLHEKELALRQLTEKLAHSEKKEEQLLDENKKLKERLLKTAVLEQKLQDLQDREQRDEKLLNITRNLDSLLECLLYDMQPDLSLLVVREKPDSRDKLQSYLLTVLAKLT